MQTIPLFPHVNREGSVLYKSLNGNDSSIRKDDVIVTLADGSIVTVKDGITTVKLPGGQIVQEGNSGLGDAKQTGSAMMAIGGAVAVIVPVGTVVGAIIAAAGALISLFANGKKAQKLAAERAQYEQVNAQLKDQNAQLDIKVQSLVASINKLKQDLGISTPISGLGFCLIGCKKKEEKRKLDSAKDVYAQLTKAQDEKISLLNKMSEEVESLLLKKRNRMLIYIGLGLAALTVGGIIIKNRK
jgi:gas vesicle protein